MTLQGQIVDKVICILSEGSQFMLNKRNAIAHLWSLKWQNHLRNISILPLTKAGPQTSPIPLLPLVHSRVETLLGLRKKQRMFVCFNVEKHVIHVIGSDTWRCQDLPWQGNDWPLLIIIKSGEEEWRESQLPVLLANFNVNGYEMCFKVQLL